MIYMIQKLMSLKPTNIWLIDEFNVIKSEHTSIFDVRYSVITLEETFSSILFSWHPFNVHKNVL